MNDKIFELVKKISTVLLLIICWVCCVVLFIAYREGKFDSAESLQLYISEFGVLAPVALTVIQTVQVIFPVLPGFLGLTAGTILFGATGGFWCNYIGMSLGSLIAFLLARICGQALVDKLFKNQKHIKWAEKMSESKFYSWFLFIGILLPLFPDDFFCYFTGLTKMSFKKFTLIIVLGKPWYILAFVYLVSKAII